MASSDRYMLLTHVNSGKPSTHLYYKATELELAQSYIQKNGGQLYDLSLRMRVK